MSQLLADCLNEIFEYLEKDNVTLYSCLLVNHLWCKVSVRILWRSDWNYNARTYITLFACLSNESKDILHKNGITIKTSTSKLPMFNYPAFCKVLSINNAENMIWKFLKHFISSQNNDNDRYTILRQEIYKLFMNQTSLKKLYYFYRYSFSTKKVVFISYPGEESCLKNLSELCCDSTIYSEFFYQLSQICHNIQSLHIYFGKVISNKLTDLISVQKSLKYLSITQSYNCESLSKDIIPSLSKLSNTLIKFKLDGEHYISLSFIAKFINLQELELSFDCDGGFNNFEKLQYITFSQLQILRIQYASPRFELLSIIKFLENNGKNLKELYISDYNDNSDNSLNLAIAKFCPNLRKLSTVGFKNNELETLKIVLNSCQYLKSIKIWCGGDYLSEKEALETILKYSHENVCEIILYHLYCVQSRLLP
jgi:hypothetical protein